MKARRSEQIERRHDDEKENENFHISTYIRQSNESWENETLSIVQQFSSHLRSNRFYFPQLNIRFSSFSNNFRHFNVKLHQYEHDGDKIVRIVTISPPISSVDERRNVVIDFYECFSKHSIILIKTGLLFRVVHVELLPRITENREWKNVKRVERRFVLKMG